MAQAIKNHDVLIIIGQRDQQGGIGLITGGREQAVVAVLPFRDGLFELAMQAQSAG